MESRINFLVDTNVWLERLLDQENASVVDDFLKLVPSNYLSVSDFSLHSIGVIMHKLGSDDKVVGNDIKMNLCNKIKDKYVNSARSLQGAG